MDPETDKAALADRDDLRVSAVVAFLAAGVVPAPSKAIMVAMLANARRTVAALGGDSTAVKAWLKDEVTRSGVRENAAVLAAAERLGTDGDNLMSAYIARHPERRGAVGTARAVVLQPGASSPHSD